jgi:DNA-binding NarL/FixJ family response regulator
MQLQCTTIQTAAAAMFPGFYTIKLYHGAPAPAQPPKRESSPVDGGMDPLIERIASLTRTQRKVLRLLAEGLSNREVGRRLGTSEGTVKIHVTAVLQRLGVRSRTHAAVVVAGVDFDAIPDQTPAKRRVVRARSMVKYSDGCARHDTTVEVAGCWLTRRQIDVLHQLAEGKANKVIAQDLGVSEGTIKVHMTALFKAIGVTNRVQAVNWWHRNAASLAGA